VGRREFRQISFVGLARVDQRIVNMGYWCGELKTRKSSR
jgi:hypothetical protein